MKALAADAKKLQTDNSRLDDIRYNKMVIEEGTGDMYKGLRKPKAGDIDGMKAFDRLRFYAEGEQLEKRLALR